MHGTGYRYEWGFIFCRRYFVVARDIKECCVRVTVAVAVSVTVSGIGGVCGGLWLELGLGVTVRGIGGVCGGAL